MGMGLARDGRRERDGAETKSLNRICDNAKDSFTGGVVRHLQLPCSMMARQHHRALIARRTCDGGGDAMDGEAR
ncbi:hypothetical protein D9M70_594070 [compost metagenome]